MAKNQNNTSSLQQRRLDRAKSGDSYLDSIRKQTARYTEALSRQGGSYAES